GLSDMTGTFEPPHGVVALKLQGTNRMGTPEGVAYAIGVPGTGTRRRGGSGRGPTLIWKPSHRPTGISMMTGQPISILTEVTERGEGKGRESEDLAAA